MHSRRSWLKLSGCLAAASVFPLSKAGGQASKKATRGTAPLKITKVEPIIVSAPNIHGPLSDYVEMPPIGTMKERTGLGYRLNHSFPSRTRGHSFDVLVKITTSEGIIGWGEAHAPVAPAVHAKVITDLLAPIIIGEDARRIGPLFEKMYSSQRLRGYATGFYTESIAAIDIALWDILGKYLNQPVYQLLGGKYRDSIPTYQGAGTPRDAEQSMQEGFTAIKMGFNKSSNEGFEVIEKVSEVVGSRGQVFIDSLGAFKLHEAIKVGRRLDELGNIGWFEDALMPEDTASYPILAEALDTAVCAGEGFVNRFQFRDLFVKRSLDIINPDVGRAGGITECKRIADMADTFGILWSPHVSSGFPPYVAASIHLAVATPNAVIMEAGNIHKATDVRSSRGNLLLKEPIEFKPGYAVVPEKPGLGIEFDEKELKKVIVN